MGLIKQQRKAVAAPYTQPRTITAAAQTIRLNDRAMVEDLRKRRTSATWQEEAWEYYDAVGEIKYALGLVASVMSRIRLYAGATLDPEAAPVSVDIAAGMDEDGKPDEDSLVEDVRKIDPKLAADAARIMEDLRARVPRLMYSSALNLQVAGECYLVNDGQGWRITSVSELEPGASGKFTIKSSSVDSSNAQTRKELDPEQSVVGRVWRPHPRYSMDADSALKALRSDCEELLLLSRMIRSTARSRMNAGILFVPDALTVAAQELPEDDNPNDEDALERELTNALIAPVTDEGSASSIVPAMLRGPAELGKEIRHISIGREASKELAERADRVLERILQGLDVPKEIAQGLNDVKYANAIVINDSLYRATIEPLALLIADAFTDIVLRPTLRAKGYDNDDIDELVVWYDPTDVVVRADSSEAANRGYQNYTLSGDAWRAANGFSDTDAPDEDELAMRLALEKSQVPPEIAQILLQKLLPSILGEAQEQAVAERQEEGLFPPELANQLGLPVDKTEPTDSTGLPEAEASPNGAQPPAQERLLQ